MKHFFDKFLIELHSYSIKATINKDKKYFSNNYLYFALLSDFKKTIDKIDFVLSKDMAYKLISQIKFLIPIIKLRDLIKKRKFNNKK